MVKTFPKISIIMNCYNGEKYLKESLKSILAQSYFNWELIFFDNSSNDNSKKIFRSFKDKRFKYFFSSKLLSLYNARKVALDKTKGDYISFLDVDDIWKKNKLKIQLRKINQTKTDFVYSNYDILKNNIFSIGFEKKQPEGFVSNVLLQHPFIPILTVFFKKKILKENNLKFDKKYNIIGDFDLFFKLSKIVAFSYIHEPLAIYRKHSQNFSILNTNLFVKEYSFWLKQNKKILSKESIKNLEYLTSYLSVKTHIFNSKYVSAIKGFIKYPLSFNKLKLLTLFLVPKKYFNF
jgi:glycosyltransferase involved in cell wall biosynthesis